MGSTAHGLVRLTAYVLWTALLVPLQVAAMALRLPVAKRLPMLYHRGCTRIIGFDVVVRGTMASAGPVLFVANHSSYLDITVLGGIIPGSFIAKSEVEGWPVFGFLSTLQKTVFINRKARGDGVEKQRDELRTRLEAGDNLILFPEGTSTDGNRVLPFKTALFAVAGTRIDGRPLAVQPVSITATRLDGIPMGICFRPFYAWYGDMDLAPHLWQVFKLGRMTVEVEFHPPLTIEQTGSRKALGERCQREVAAGVSRALSGRPAPMPVPAPSLPETQPEEHPAAPVPA